MSRKETQLLICIIILLVLISIISFLPRQTSPKEQQKNVEFLSQEYIQGAYLDDSRFSDVEFFPIAYIRPSDQIYFEDTFGNARTYGGDRIHEGTDLMTDDNIRGAYPVVSVCDGTVTHMGWLELGGYRIGIRSSEGVYYYYAHLYRYDTLLTEGSTVHAGQILGYAGDSGYGQEGTTGQFDVHLHFGIYLTDENGTEIAINPYPLLKKLRNKILKYF